VIHNFRNFDYFSKTDFRPRWETKTAQLSNLRTVDFFTNFWGPKLICHTFRELRLRSRRLRLHFDRDADEEGPGLFGDRRFVPAV
jgi:hypothetical protein